MEHQNTLIWEVTFWEFVLVTVVLAGGAAYLTGRAIASVWQGTTHIVVYMVLLAGATRFIHFALFRGTLLSLHYYVVDLIVLLIAAGIGFTVTRRRQMERQYGFLRRDTAG
ncbi:MAG: hypothetical protein IH590_17605 [Aquamicrobium sp.]|jgi:hypothetical protein|nr:hypothetical protein [Aquamicrobium sp.]